MISQSTKQSESVNDIFVRRKRKVIVPQASGESPAEELYVASFVKNLESVGYFASEDLIAACSKLSLIALTELNYETLGSLQKALGAHRQFKPMYPNFPSQVMNMSEARLYWNAFIHYLSGGRLKPSTTIQPRPALTEEQSRNLLNTGTLEEFEKLFTQIASSNTSISEQDRSDLAWYIAHYADDIKRLLPEKMPNRETRAFICAKLLELTKEPKSLVTKLCDTATDVLRVAVAMSDGDVSLAEPVKFRQFKRPERRLLLEILEAQKNLTEDMNRWKVRWIRLGERLHPGEYANKYPMAAKAFDVLRNDLPIGSFNSKLEVALSKRDLGEITAMLQSRPGDFARRLDHVLRLAGATGHSSVLETFTTAADRVSTPVLIQVMHHFAQRNSKPELRIFLPKGQVAKAQAIPNNLPPLDPEVCGAVTEICRKTLLNRFAKLPPLGKCFIDPQLKNYLVPFSQRSASKALRTIARGSRLSLPDTDTLRFFIWWKNGKSRTDIDLSASMFDKDFAYVSAITYYNLKDFGGVHSGDIVDAPHGASEFIDISRSRCLKRGVRYIVMSVSSFTEQPYCDLPECFAGWMGREKPDSGEIYEPKTVQDKLDLAANSKIALPAIFDLQDGDVIWADMSLTKWPYWYNTVAANLWGIQLTLKSLVSLSKPNLYDLLRLHVAARGELVESASEADTVFSVEVGTPFDLGKIASEFMS